MSYDDGAWILKKYGRGIQRLPLWKVGPHPINRGGFPLSGKHVMSLGADIVFKRGFQQHLYGHGICLEPEPDSPKVVYNWYKKMAEKDPLLPTPREGQEYGSIAKSHLSTVLQALSLGSMRWDHDGSPMKAPENAEQLQDHLKHGMYWLVLDHMAIRDHREKVENLMRSANNEQEVSLGENEVAMLFKMSHLCHNAPKPIPGQSKWDVARELALRTAGARWEEAELLDIYNLAMTLSRDALQFVVDAHFQYVNATALRCKPSFFGEVADLDEEFMWPRVALILRQYMSEKTEVERVGSFCVCNAITSAQVKAIGQDKELLMATHGFIADVLTKYAVDNLGDIDKVEHMRAMVGMFARAGSALKARKQDRLPQVEASLREKLMKACPAIVLPSPVLDATTALQKTNATSTAASASRSRAPVALSQPLTAAGSEMKDDPAYKLAKAGFVIGCRVRLNKSLSKILRNTEGSMVGVVNTLVEVAWDGGQSVTSVASKNLDILLEEEAPAPAEKKRKTEDSLVWMVASSSLATASLLQLVKAMVFQLHVASVPSPDHLALTQKSGRKVTALKDFPANGLVLVPWSTEMVQHDGTDQEKIHETIEVRVPRAPPMCVRAMSMTTGCKSGEEDPKVFNPFWFVAKPDSEEPGETAFNMTLEMVVFDNAMALKCKTDFVKPVVTGLPSPSITVPILVNKAPIKAGECLTRA